MGSAFTQQDLRCAGSQAGLGAKGQGAKGHGWSRASTELSSGLTPEGGVVSRWKFTAGDTSLLWHVCKETSSHLFFHRDF